MESTANVSGYAFGADNPTLFVDPLGLRYQFFEGGPPDQGTGDNPGGLWDDGGGGGGGFFSYMDKNGTKWHHKDVLAGTAAAGIPYQEDFGWDSFGNSGNTGFERHVKKGTQHGVQGYYSSQATSHASGRCVSINLLFL